MFTQMLYRFALPRDVFTHERNYLVRMLHNNYSISIDLKYTVARQAKYELICTQLIDYEDSYMYNI